MKLRNSVINYTLTIVEHITHQGGNKLSIRIDNQVPTNIYKKKSFKGSLLFPEVSNPLRMNAAGLVSALSSLAKSYSFSFKKVNL